MRALAKSTLPAIAALALGACDVADESQSSAEETPATPEAQRAPPYKPVASITDLMRSTITVSAEEYWGSVSIVVDENGVTENMPEGDEEWRLVWAAGITLAESGNLLMMPPRAIDEPDWMAYSEDLVDVGLEAAQAAEDRDFEAVLAVGERIYNVCLECHRHYVPALPDL